MHSLFLPVALVVLVLVVVPAGCAEAPDPVAPAPRSFVVIELFTSEGCSSCPPADALVSKLLDRARRQNLPIFALSFHVDYWNQLGWTDPFSAAEFSRRQRGYATAFKTSEMYTPQVFVNGRAGFVGSDSKEADKQIRSALATPGKVDLAMKAAAMIDGNTRVEYRATGAAAGDVINFALVERNVAIEVKRGENAGRKLSHDNVVRYFRTRPLVKQSTGHIDLKLPDKLERPNASIIAYIQDPRSQEIVGAASIDP